MLPVENLIRWHTVESARGHVLMIRANGFVANAEKNTPNAMINYRQECAEKAVELGDRAPSDVVTDALACFA